MSITSSTRREFLTTASAAAAAAILPGAARGAELSPQPARWPIGSHTRPFTSFRASQAANPDYVLDAVKAGATGYLLKEISTDEVATAIRAVADGQSQISPSMASKLLTEFKSMIQRTDERRLLPAPKLTDRELEVLKLVAKGLNNRDIAKELFISENTVKNHIRNILEKLQLHSRMEAVVYAVREKLLEIT